MINQVENAKNYRDFLAYKIKAIRKTAKISDEIKKTLSADQLSLIQKKILKKAEKKSFSELNIAKKTKEYQETKKIHQENKGKSEDKKFNEYLSYLKNKGIDYKIMALDDIKSNIKDILKNIEEKNSYELPFLDIKIQDGKVFVLREVHSWGDEQQGMRGYITEKAGYFQENEQKVVVSVFDGDMNMIETTKPYIFKKYLSNPYKSRDDKISMSKTKPRVIQYIKNGEVILDTGDLLTISSEINKDNFTQLILDKENKSLITEKINGSGTFVEILEEKGKELQKTLIKELDWKKSIATFKTIILNEATKNYDTDKYNLQLGEDFITDNFAIISVKVEKNIEGLYCENEYVLYVVGDDYPEPLIIKRIYSNFDRWGGLKSKIHLSFEKLSKNKFSVTQINKPYTMSHLSPMNYPRFNDKTMTFNLPISKNKTQ